MLLGLSPALAASVALLPLDGRGVDANVAADATEALRDALAAEGSVDVPTATALSDLLLELASAPARDPAAIGPALAPGVR